MFQITNQNFFNPLTPPFTKWDEFPLLLPTKKPAVPAASRRLSWPWVIETTASWDPGKKSWMDRF
jgi:hypothetical protein